MTNHWADFWIDFEETYWDWRKRERNRRQFWSDAHKEATSRRFRMPDREMNGKKHCRLPRCENPLPKRRTSWCSNEHMWLGYRIGSNFSEAVLWYYGGICVLCGIDCGEIDAWLAHYRLIDRDLYRAACATLKAAGFDPDTRAGEADHVVPVVEGGPTTLENGRVLCQPCHKRETRFLQQRLNRSRRMMPQIAMNFDPDTGEMASTNEQ